MSQSLRRDSNSQNPSKVSQKLEARSNVLIPDFACQGDLKDVASIGPELATCPSRIQGQKQFKHASAISCDARRLIVEAVLAPLMRMAPPLDGPLMPPAEQTKLWTEMLTGLRYALTYAGHGHLNRPVQDLADLIEDLSVGEHRAIDGRFPQKVKSWKRPRAIAGLRFWIAVTYQVLKKWLDATQDEAVDAINKSLRKHGLPIQERRTIQKWNQDKEAKTFVDQMNAPKFKLVREDTRENRIELVCDFLIGKVTPASRFTAKEI